MEQILLGQRKKFAVSALTRTQGFHHYSITALLIWLFLISHCYFHGVNALFRGSHIFPGVCQCPSRDGKKQICCSDWAWHGNCPSSASLELRFPMMKAPDLLAPRSYFLLYQLFTCHKKAEKLKLSVQPQVSGSTRLLKQAMWLGEIRKWNHWMGMRRAEEESINSSQELSRAI